jgi:hypothetical protein
MRTWIDVKDEAEAHAIRTALADEQCRAFVVVLGTLLPRTPRTQARILSYVHDKLLEEGGTR